MKGTQGLIIISVIGLVIISAFVLNRRSYYSDKHPLLDQIRSNFAMLNSEYTQIPLKIGDSAYTENKSVITLCLKNPHTGKYYDMNTLMYVSLHELAHILSKTHGHNNEFKDNFATLLRQSSKIGIYNPQIPIPSTYCGIGNDTN